MRKDRSLPSPQLGFAKTVALSALVAGLVVSEAGSRPTAALAAQAPEPASVSKTRATVAVWRQEEDGVRVLGEETPGESTPILTSVASPSTAGRKCVMVPGDYDGDGFLDIATCYEPAPPAYPNFDWRIVRSSDSAIVAESFGVPGDVPSPRDFGGRTQIAIYRPPESKWYVSQSGSSNDYTEAFGAPGETLLQNANYGGLPSLDRASWNPETGVWRFRYDGDEADAFDAFGEPGDVPVPADYDGDGRADEAVFRPSDGTWWIARSATADVATIPWGMAGDVPVPADFDGDGRAEPCVFRVVGDDAYWWILNVETGAIRMTQFGRAGDVPVPGVYRTKS